MIRIEWLLARKEETVLNVFKLKSMLRENDTLAILMNGSPDPDAVASAMALREILNQTKPLEKCIFVATEPVIRYQNAEFIREMKVDIQMLDKVDLKEFRLIAVVDAQPTFFGDKLGEIKPQIVIDHHPCNTVWHASLADVRKGYGALCTIMTEYLLVARAKISKRLYTALLYGIKSDTVNFERDVSLEDIGAYYLTFRRANRQLVRRIELNQIPEKFLKYFDYACQHKRRYRDRVIIFLGAVESPDACVQVADFFLRVINIFYVIIAGIDEGQDGYHLPGRRVPAGLRRHRQKGVQPARECRRPPERGACGDPHGNAQDRPGRRPLPGGGGPFPRPAAPAEGRTGNIGKQKGVTGVETGPSPGRGGVDTCRLFFSFRLRRGLALLRRRGCALFFFLLAAGRLLSAVVRGIPAAPLQVERGEGHHLVHGTSAESAGLRRGVRNSLEQFEFFTAFLALILINWH